MGRGRWKDPIYVHSGQREVGRALHVHRGLEHYYFGIRTAFAVGIIKVHCLGSGECVAAWSIYLLANRAGIE